MPAAHADLVERLAQALREYAYVEVKPGPLGGIAFVARIQTPRLGSRLLGGVRYVCAVVEAPADLRDVEGARDFVESIRHVLAEGPPRAAFKSMGTYVVLLCPRPVFEALDGHEAAFLDRTGLHRNTLLGVVLADLDRFDSAGACTWGLLYSGRHYGAIRATVLYWCDQHKPRPDAP